MKFSRSAADPEPKINGPDGRRLSGGGRSVEKNEESSNEESNVKIVHRGDCSSTKRLITNWSFEQNLSHYTRGGWLILGCILCSA